MLSVVQLTEEQFIRPATLEAVKHEAFDLIEHLMAPEGKKLADAIEQKLAIPGLEARAPEIYQQYQRLAVYLKLMSIACQDNDAVFNLVKNNYLDGFEIGININEIMIGKAYSIPDLAWPEYAEQLIGALKQNSQRIGQQQITIKGEPSPTQPSIKNWISDYDRIFGPEKIDDLKREEYLAKNSNAKILNQEDKAKLRNVFQFYDNLKPIPLSLVNQALKELGIDEEIAKEFPEAAPMEQPAAPYAPPPQEVIPTAKRYARPEGPARDTYLEPMEEEIKKPAPFVPPAPQRPAPPSQPAYTRPPQPQPPQKPTAFQPPQSTYRPQPTYTPPTPPQRTPPIAPQPKPPAPSPLPQPPKSPPSQPPQPTYRPPQSPPAPTMPSPQRPAPPLPRPAQPPAPTRPQPFAPSAPQAPPSVPRPVQPPVQPAQPIQRDTYLEPIDTTPRLAPKPITPPPGIRPLPPAPQRPPEPRIEGNIIDLKNPEK